MDANEFWGIIEDARRPTGRGPEDPSASADNLKKVLSPFSDSDLKEFMVAFIQRQLELNRWNIWGAGYVITQGMGDDSFHYFVSWIIGKGRACYEAALLDPDTLGDFVKVGEDVDNELLEYVAIELLDKRGLPDPRDSVDGSLDENDPQGEAFDEDTVNEDFPKLAAKFG